MYHSEHEPLRKGAQIPAKFLVEWEFLFQQFQWNYIF